MIKQPKNSPGLVPIGVLDLGYWSLGCLVDPPQPPQWAPGAPKCEGQCVSWSPGPSIFRSFFRFDFGLDFGAGLRSLFKKNVRFSPHVCMCTCKKLGRPRRVLGSSWGRFGGHLGLQNRPKKFTRIEPEPSGRSIFRSFFRFDFELNFGLVLGPFRARLGLLLDPFWKPKSGQVGSKMRLQRIHF